MNNIVKINNSDMAVKEYNGQRVITFKDIDMVHERPDGTAKRNFYTNKKYFIEGVDFFLLKQSESSVDEIRTLKIPNRGLTVFTESGYLMLVRSFTDDLAWKVQRKLVNTYFKAKSDVQELPLSFEDRIRLAELIKGTPSDRLSIICAIFQLADVSIPETSTYADYGARKGSCTGRKSPVYSSDRHINDFLQGANLLNRPTNDVYKEYVEYCSNQKLVPVSHIAFSKMVNKILGTYTVVKRLGRISKRVFVR